MSPSLFSLLNNNRIKEEKKKKELCVKDQIIVKNKLKGVNLFF